MKTSDACRECKFIMTLIFALMEKTYKDVSDVSFLGVGVRRLMSDGTDLNFRTPNKCLNMNESHFDKWTSFFILWKVKQCCLIGMILRGLKRLNNPVFPK